MPPVSHVPMEFVNVVLRLVMQRKGSLVKRTLVNVLKANVIRSPIHVIRTMDVYVVHTLHLVQKDTSVSMEAVNVVLGNVVTRKVLLLYITNICVDR